jgi:hypothetical protein
MEEAGEPPAMGKQLVSWTCTNKLPSGNQNFRNLKYKKGHNSGKIVENRHNQT